MSKVRLKFSKLGMGKYISHPDLLRAFTRAIRRAKLPVAYSQGFNPHQKMAFALPLPIGVTSDCEYVDVEFIKDIEFDELCTRLNDNLPPDIRIISASAPNLAANTIVSAEYIIKLMLSSLLSESDIKEFFGVPEISVIKKTKKGDKTVNLLSFVKAYEVLSIEDNLLTLRTVLDAGGERNLKPEILVNTLEKILQPNGFLKIDIHRKNVFSAIGDTFVPFI